MFKSLPLKNNIEVLVINFNRSSPCHMATAVVTKAQWSKHSDRIPTIHKHAGIATQRYDNNIKMQRITDVWIPLSFVKTSIPLTQLYHCTINHILLCVALDRTKVPDCDVIWHYCVQDDQYRRSNLDLKLKCSAFKPYLQVLNATSALAVRFDNSGMNTN